MAEIMNALTASHPALGVAFTFLQAAYTLYNSVQGRKAQLKALLDRCKDLLLQVGNSLGRRIDMSMGHNIKALTRYVIYPASF